ncbi:MAG: right-handed parallel beta-helix repeat-containing protein [Thermoplasmata archaeon]|nr:MAG: right-handed parallel beta-helix repeat-containing protein [Thermoplasmata archaeon]
MKKAIMSVLTVWILVSSMFIGLISFSDVDTVQAPYILHNPIRINSNAEFASMAGIEGWTGNGLPGNPYIIEGYDINGSGYGCCIYIGNTTVYFKIKDSYLHEASGVYNPPYFVRSGLTMYNIQNATIVNNTSSSNNDHGIYLDSSSSNNTISNNIASSNGNYGIYIKSKSNSNTISNNSASNNENGIYLSSSNSNRIINNTVFSNNLYGINLSSSNSNTISKNNVSNNIYGLCLSESNHNTITNKNAFYYNQFGIYLDSSNNNMITNNNVSYNNFGIYLYISGNNTVGNNTVFLNNHEGIVIDASSNNTIAHNNAFSNILNGIYIGFSSNNTITYNHLSNNYRGISLYSSTGNKIYHNNIINNTFQAKDNTNNGNLWDNGYPSGGNYWSDYTGVDLNSTPAQNVPPPDGIGDTNYSIDNDSADNYPLMNHIGNFTFLYEGWNLISIPFIQSDSNLKSVLSSINGSFDAIQRFNVSNTSDPWKHYQISKPSHLNDLMYINHIIGLWIHITEPGGVLFRYYGTQPTSNQSIPLHLGWNMVGWASLTNKNRTAALNNLTFGSEVDSIWTFDAANKNWVEISGEDYFEVGRGYWIHATQECVWEVPI